MEEKAQVYILVDGEGRIVGCEGGYSEANIDDKQRWTLIDEGYGDSFNLCQSHYFEGGLYTSDGICRWRYTEGTCILREEAEIEEERRISEEANDEATMQDMLNALERLGVKTDEEDEAE